MKANSFPVVIKYRFGWLMMLFLLVVFMAGMVAGLTDSIWRLSSSWLLPLGLIAIITGWCAGGGKRKGISYFVIGIISGVMILILYQSEAYLNLFWAYFNAQQTQLISKPLIFTHPNIGPLIYHLYTAINNLITYFSQFSFWLRNIFINQGAPSLTAINLFWGSLLWSVSFSMGWFLRRKIHAFLASLPALILTTSVIGYTRRETTGLIITLGAILALIVLSEQLIREHEWQIQQIDYSEEIRFDIITYSIPLLGLIIALAYFIPSISLDHFRSLLNMQNRAASERQLDLSTSLGLDQEPLDSITGFPQGGLPRSHLIGSGNELSEQKIMEISPGEFFLPPQVDPDAQLPTYYWFGQAFDNYTGISWTTGETQDEIVLADQQIPGIDETEENLVKHTILKTDSALTMLYFTGHLQSVNQTITIFRLETTQEFFYGQTNTKQYQVITAISDFPEDQLRQSTATPPELIQETYLQLPPGISNRVSDLANRLTDQELTPYAKAKLIESYLRQFEYTLDLPSPPQDREIVDYFLFDLQKGYCDYYASAMVVLARLSGLPARFVIGYGPGSYDYTQQRFVVTEANAHAWPEIYIEPFGWVPFEPTASFAPRVWGTGSEDALSSIPIGTEERRQETTIPNLHPALNLLLLAILVLTVWWFVLRYKRNNKPTVTQIESIYTSTRTHLTHLFLKLNTEHTPQEFSRAYSKFLLGRSRSKLSQKLTQQVVTHLNKIVILYEEGVYSSRGILIDQVTEARINLNFLRLRSLLLKTVYSFKKY